MNMLKRRSPELVAFAVELYKEHGSCHKVAKMLAVGSTTVYRMLTDAGVNIPARGAPELNARKHKLTGDVANKVVAAYAAGESMRKIMQDFNCGQVAVYGAVERAGVQRRTIGQQPRRVSDDARKEMVRLYSEEGWTQSQIARRFGTHQSAVRSFMLQAGVLRFHGKAKGEKHGSWKGGVVNLPTGYIGVRISAGHKLHSMANSAGYIPEHRLRVAEFLGRPLESHETVHHKDGNRQNNSLDNLQLRSGKHGKGCVMTCRACGSHDIQSEDI